MSAPQTNIEKQKKFHRTPLFGILAVVVVALLLFFALGTFVAEDGGTPEGAAVQIDGRTGEPVVTE